MANMEDGNVEGPGEDMSNRTELAKIAKSTGLSPGRLNGSGPIAVVDIGSNSVRLVVYERLSRSATPLFNEKELCGLARGIEASGRLDPEAIASALASIRRFKAITNQLAVKELHVLATAAPRDASNGPEFVKAVEAITGVPINMLTGAEEARLTALGVISGFHDPDGIAGDLGGGSLEVIDVKGATVGVGETFPIGGLRLEEGSQKSIKKAEKIVAEALAKSTVLPGGAGQAVLCHRRHLALARPPAHAAEGLSAPRHARIRDQCRRGGGLLPHGDAARHRLARLDRGGVAEPAAAPRLWRGGARPGDQGDAPVEDRALGARRARGPALRSPAGGGEGPRSADRRLRGTRLAPRRARRRMPTELPAWSEMAFAAIGLDETAEEARLRHAACLLADIGWRAHPEYRGEQSLNLISNAAFIGVDHPGRAYLALANFYRHEGLIDEALSPHIRELASTRYHGAGAGARRDAPGRAPDLGGHAGHHRADPARAARQDAGADPAGGHGAARRARGSSAGSASSPSSPGSSRRS